MVVVVDGVPVSSTVGTASAVVDGPGGGRFCSLVSALGGVSLVVVDVEGVHVPDD